MRLKFFVAIVLVGLVSLAFVSFIEGSIVELYHKSLIERREQFIIQCQKGGLSLTECRVKYQKL